MDYEVYFSLEVAAIFARNKDVRVKSVDSLRREPVRSSHVQIAVIVLFLLYINIYIRPLPLML